MMVSILENSYLSMKMTFNKSQVIQIIYVHIAYV